MKYNLNSAYYFSLTIFISFFIFVTGTANTDYVGSILGNKEDIKKGLDLKNKKGKKPVKEAGYSPYAGTNYPTKVLWGDTHLHTKLSLDAPTPHPFGIHLRAKPE